MKLKRLVKAIVLGIGLIGIAVSLPAVTGLEVYKVITNYPNPFDSRQENTTILYTLVTDSEVKANIYDLFGNPIKVYPEKKETAGIKMIVWDGTDDNGSKVTKGGYICVVEIRNGGMKVMATRKIGVVH
jgi:flagellar hook assembly protein FlgD